MYHARISRNLLYLMPRLCLILLLIPVLENYRIFWIVSLKGKVLAGYGCSNCGSKQLFKQHLFHRAPRVLVIQIDRAIYANQTLSKDQSVIEVPSMFLNFQTKRGNKLIWTPYTLKAVVCHEGVSPVQGHYYTYANHDDKWYRCNDDKVMEINKKVIMPTLNSRHTYIYVFEKHS